MEGKDGKAEVCLQRALHPLPHRALGKLWLVVVCFARPLRASTVAAWHPLRPTCTVISLQESSGESGGMPPMRRFVAREDQDPESDEEEIEVNVVQSFKDPITTTWLEKPVRKWVFTSDLPQHSKLSREELIHPNPPLSISLPLAARHANTSSRAGLSRSTLGQLLAGRRRNVPFLGAPRPFASTLSRTTHSSNDECNRQGEGKKRAAETPRESIRPWRTTMTRMRMRRWRTIPSRPTRELQLQLQQEVKRRAKRRRRKKDDSNACTCRPWMMH